MTDAVAVAASAARRNSRPILLAHGPGPIAKGKRAAWFCAGWVVLLTGCVPPPVWHRFTPSATAPNPPADQRVEIWTNVGTVWYWYRVAITPESISGVPYNHTTFAFEDAPGIRAPRPASQDARRVAIPFGTVDSIRVGSASPWAVPLLVFYIAAVVARLVVSKT